MYKKLLIFNAGVLAALGYLVLNGYLIDAFFGFARYPVWALFVLTGIGIGLIGFNRFDDCKWIANHMTRFGMIGTLIGMIQGLTGLEFTTSEVSSMATELAHHTGFAFYSTLVGVVGNIWLNLNLRMVRE